MRFQNKVVVITGTAGGQGREAAIRFAHEGAIVAGCDVNSPGNLETQKQVEAAGGRMISHAPVDLTIEAEVTKWIDDVVSQAGKIDVFYANAGATKFSPVAETSFEDWQFVLKHELDIVFLPIKHAWKHLIASMGNIILVGSTAGVSGSVTNTRVAHSATKGGVIAMGRQLAAEGAQHGIRVNTVSPGMIRTPATENDLLAADHPMRNIEKAIPLGRIGSSAEVVNCALFLASDEASYVTGANLMVDGGWSAVLPS
jgi:meso-butanediol dehydrogenase/(S,S)-butanediol dehydrogenase/diacetyl reductase